MSEKKITALVVAAGSGSRFGGGTPKQFVSLGGVPLLARTLAVFERAARVTEIAVAVPTAYIEMTKRDIVAAYGFKKAVLVTGGGNCRQASVYAALKALGRDTALVLIHDGVRPFVTERIINDVIDCAEAGYGAVAGVRLTDTVKRTDGDGFVTETPSRDGLWAVQTPQGFGYETILRAHYQAVLDGFTGTDDAVLAERLPGVPVKMVRGDTRNIKITSPEDLAYGESILHMKWAET